VNLGSDDGGTEVGMTDLTVTTAINAPLLSRFDLVLLLTDKCGEEWDEAVSTFVLNGSISQKCEHERANRTASAIENLSTSANPQSSSHGTAFESPTVPFWTLQQLQNYVAFVKSTFNPELSQEAMTVLECYYQVQLFETS
jgi:DNA helicase MCM9